MLTFIQNSSSSYVLNLEENSPINFEPLEPFLNDPRLDVGNTVVSVLSSLKTNNSFQQNFSLRAFFRSCSAYELLD
jgi:hypothetical protein